MKYTYLKTFSFILLAFGVFTLSGCDGTTGIPSDEQIVGTAVGSPPVAVAVVTPDYINTYGLSGDIIITLDGTGSSDPDGDIVSYEWYLSSDTNPTAVHVASGEYTELVITDYISIPDLVPGQYMFTLLVTDSEGSSDRTDANVTVVNIGGDSQI